MACTLRQLGRSRHPTSHLLWTEAIFDVALNYFTFHCSSQRAPHHQRRSRAASRLAGNEMTARTVLKTFCRGLDFLLARDWTAAEARRRAVVSACRSPSTLRHAAIEAMPSVSIQPWTLWHSCRP